MKTIEKQFIAGLVITFMSSCSTTVYQSLRQTKPVMADGNSDEWSIL